MPLPGRLVRRFALAASQSAWILLSGCADLLEVELPGRVVSSTLDRPGLAPTVVNSLIADFECAFNSYVAGTALLTDEMQHSSGNTAPRRWDLREVDETDNDLASSNCEAFGFGSYTPLQTARFQAEDALRRLEAFSDAQVPNRTSLMATAAAFAGYANMILGEGFCEMAVDGGPLLTRAAMFDLAEQRFTRALTFAQTANNQQMLNLARVGRARVRLDAGKRAEAAADARLVPSTFVENVTRSSEAARRSNKIWRFNQSELHITVAPPFRNLTWQGVPDPRVNVIDARRGGQNTQVPLWLAAKHATEASPIRLASWVEAQLIIAEVEAGQTAVNIINELHQRANIPSFNSADPQAIAAQVVEERRRELFLEGHRINDMLRFNIPFPSGLHPVDANQYGRTTCMPLPLVERTGNPNIGRR